MNANKILAPLFAVCLLLSACRKAAPEAGSQPGTSVPPTSSSTVTTAPPTTATTAPPTTAAPIKQEVTPKGSYVWNGLPWSSDGSWTTIDSYAKNHGITDYVRINASVYLAADQLLPVYMDGYLPAIFEVAPDDTYLLVAIRPFPSAVAEYGGCDSSDEFRAIWANYTAILRQRLIDAGYAIYPERYSDEEEEFGYTRVMVFISVGEIKELHCGDDISVEVVNPVWPNTW